MAKLKDRVAVVTGCGPNITGGIAYALADDGAKLVCVDVRGDYAEGCAKAIRSRGGDAIGIACDVTSEEQVQSAVRKAEQTYGGIDILVNGAVIQIRKGLLDMPVADFRRQTDLILSGVFLFTQHAARSMITRKRPGSIMVILSTEAHQGNPGSIGYGTAKGGLANFVRAAAMDLAQYGIRVNALTPTGTDPSEGVQRAKEWGVEWIPDGPATVAARPDKTVGGQGVPLGKRPSPRHYGRAAVFLASDDAEMITGMDLRVDGGTIARYWRWNPGAKVSAAD